MALRESAKSSGAGPEVRAGYIRAWAVDGVVVEVSNCFMRVRYKAGPELWHICRTLALGRFCTLSKPVSVHNNVTALGKVFLPRALWYCLNCSLGTQRLGGQEPLLGNYCHNV